MAVARAVAAVMAVALLSMCGAVAEGTADAAAAPTLPPACGTNECLVELFNHEHIFDILTASGLSLEDLGSYQACNHKSSLHFCVAQSMDVVTQGLCVPRACSAEQLQFALDSFNNATKPQFHQWLEVCGALAWNESCSQHNPPGDKRDKCIKSYGAFEPVIETAVDGFLALFGALTPTVHCGDGYTSRWSPGSIVMLFVCAVILLLALAQLVREHAWRRSLTEEEHAFFSSSTAGGGASIQGGELRPVGGREREGALGFVLSCFSISKNFGDLASQSPKRSLKMLDGLRAFSMFHIILGHTYNFELDVNVQDGSRINDYLGTWTAQGLFAAQYAVDTFFFLSGLLTAYVVGRKMSKSGKGIPFAMSILLRYLRITPLLAFIVGFYGTLTKHMGTGPLWYRMHSDTQYCGKYWWTNLLYINNFVPANYHHQCVPWAWYLANDMQFFILGVAILLIYNRSKMAGKVAALLLTLGCMVGNAAVVAHNHLSPSNNRGQNLTYDKPWTRGAPYAVGLLAAFMLLEHGKTLASLSRRKGLALLAYGVGMLALIVYSTATYDWSKPGGNWSYAANIIFALFSRGLWGTAVAAIVFAIYSGNGSLAGWLLTLPIWEPFGKLTFGAYLFHPAWIRVVYYQQQHLDHLEFMTAPTLFLGFAVFSYAAATILYVLVEMPAANMVAALTSRRR